MPALTTGALFDRRARLTIILPQGQSFSDTDPGQNALVIEGGYDESAGAIGLRIVGKITKTSQKQPNTGEIHIYNLAPNTRALLKQKGVRLVLEAGYKDTGVSQVFLGDVRTADHVREKADWNTVLKCGDGERSFRYAWAGNSFAKNTQVADVLKYCASAMGLSLGNTTTQAAKLSTVLYHGWTVHGPASSELDRIVKAVGLSYSIQDGVLQVLAPGESLAQSIPVLTPDTGLIGSPEMGSPEKKGKPQSLKFKSLLLPQLRPGGRVQIKSERYDAIFRLRKVEPDFDTHGGPWYSDCEGIADGSVKVA